MDKITKYLITKAEKVDKRVLRFIGSDESIDRDGDQIMVDNWDLADYKNNPVVLFGHRYSEEPVARTKRVWVNKAEKRLMFDIEFPDSDISSKGDSLYKLYKSGFMKATSVGFLPDFKKVEYPENKSGKGPYRIYKGQKLLEISLVSVGSNSRALLTSKSMDEAIENKVIDQIELDELLACFEEKATQTASEAHTDVIDKEAIQEHKEKSELKNAEIKIMELELQLVEQKMDEEIEEDDLYSQLFDEFVAEPKKQKEDIIDDTLAILKETK